jgi:hypothetical protein
MAGMSDTNWILGFIALLLFLILWELSSIKNILKVFKQDDTP